MSSWLFLFIFFLSIFLIIIYIYFKSRSIKLTREDYYHWLKISNKIRFSQTKLIKNVFQPLKASLDFLFFNFLEKILRRIKIEALKLETWASQKIEKIKQRRETKQ